MTSPTRGVRWMRASAQDLLGHMHAAFWDRLELWQRMPLHRFEDGSRGAIEFNAWRAGDGLAGLPDVLRNELRILAPDAGVADLYEAIPALDEEGVLQAMLFATDPHRFAQRIVDTLPRADGHVRVLTERMRALVQDRPWLPNADGGGIAPKELLLVPPDLLRSCVVSVRPVRWPGTYRAQSNQMSGPPRKGSCGTSSTGRVERCRFGGLLVR